LGLLCSLINLYVIALFARVILSWFPISPSSPMASVFSFLYTITEPVLGPIRRAMPRMGVFDFSPIIAVIGVRLVAGLVLGC
jgi:YggT family protein